MEGASMAEPAFDTLTIAKELERDYGFDARQAEGAATMIHRHLVGNVATRNDLMVMREALDADFEKIDRRFETVEKRLEDLEGKIDGLATKDELSVLEERIAMKMTIRLGGLIVGTLLFFEVLNRFFPASGLPPGQ